MALNYPCSDLFQSFLNARGIYRNNLTGQIPLFDIIAEYERECCDKILFPDISKRMELLLKNERNSWRLIKGVFDDRLRDLGNNRSANCSQLLNNMFMYLQKNSHGTVRVMK